MFSRAVSLGGWHLTQAVAKANDVDWATAETLKHGARLATATVAEWDDEEATHSTEPAPPTARGDATTDAIRDALTPSARQPPDDLDWIRGHLGRRD